jgi:hypothetical protein
VPQQHRRAEPVTCTVSGPTLVVIVIDAVV